MQTQDTHFGSESRDMQSKECVKAIALCDYGLGGVAPNETVSFLQKSVREQTFPTQPARMEPAPKERKVYKYSWAGS